MVWRTDKSYFCRRTGSCCGCMRTLNLVYKMFKIHSIPYLGFWVLLGLGLTALLTLDQAFCKYEEEHNSTHSNSTTPTYVCDEEITGVTKTAGALVFSIATFATLAGSWAMLVAFVRMLYATHHTLQNIADPNGDFMDSGIWDLSPPHDISNSSIPRLERQRSPPSERPMTGARSRGHHRRRPYAVGGGFPWVGSVLQLFVEFLLVGLISSLLFGTIPAVMAMWLLLCKGHRFEYVTAPKPQTSRPREEPRAPLPPGVSMETVET